jgi:hypothetical protein
MAELDVLMDELEGSRSGAQADSELARA